MAKKIILIIIILIIGFGIWNALIKEEKPEYSLVEVIRGDVFQEVSETGQVKKGEEIKLGFPAAGKIEKIYVEVGDEVKANQRLAELDTTQLEIQLKEAKAALSVSQAKLEKLLAGATPEEIKVAETAVKNAKISLESAQQNLADIKATGEDNLKAAYEDALNVLDNSYLKAYNTFQAVDIIQRTYFERNDLEGIEVREEKDKIENNTDKIKTYLDPAKANPIEENIDLSLSETKLALEEIYTSLEIIREDCETPFYRNLVSLTDKTVLDTHRSYINTALTNVTNSQQTISSTKLTNTYNINTAQAKESLAEGSLEAAQAELSRITASPPQEDIDLYQAQIKQAQAKIDLLENQMGQAVLKSPVSGQVVEVKKKIGEQVQPMLQDIVITLLPTSPFQIKVDIYEEDVVKMKINNPVEISLVAFPEKTFKGKLVAIDPAEKLIEGVVYYEVTIDFEKIPEEVKPGMTADLVIKTASKENVLVVPKDAIQKKVNKTMVEVFKDGVNEEREIEIGLWGSNDMVEVTSGLKEGEKVILR